MVSVRSIVQTVASAAVLLTAVCAEERRLQFEGLGDIVKPLLREPSSASKDTPAPPAITPSSESQASGSPLSKESASSELESARGSGDWSQTSSADASSGTDEMSSASSNGQDGSVDSATPSDGLGGLIPGIADALIGKSSNASEPATPPPTETQPAKTETPEVTETNDGALLNANSGNGSADVGDASSTRQSTDQTDDASSNGQDESKGSSTILDGATDAVSDLTSSTDGLGGDVSDLTSSSGGLGDVVSDLTPSADGSGGLLPNLTPSPDGSDGLLPNITPSPDGSDGIVPDLLPSNGKEDSNSDALTDASSSGESGGSTTEAPSSEGSEGLIPDLLPDDGIGGLIPTDAPSSEGSSSTEASSSNGSESSATDAPPSGEPGDLLPSLPPIDGSGGLLPDIPTEAPSSDGSGDVLPTLPPGDGSGDVLPTLSPGNGSGDLPPTEAPSGSSSNDSSPTMSPSSSGSGDIPPSVSPGNGSDANAGSQPQGHDNSDTGSYLPPTEDESGIGSDDTNSSHENGSSGHQERPSVSKDHNSEESDSGDYIPPSKIPNVVIDIGKETNAPSSNSEQDDDENDNGMGQGEPDVIMYTPDESVEEASDKFAIPDIVHSDDQHPLAHHDTVKEAQILTTSDTRDKEENDNVLQYRRGDISKNVETDATYVQNGDALSGATSAFYNFMRYASVSFAGVSVALLLFFHYISLDSALVWTNAAWSPNTWEFILYGAYLQQLSSISHLTLTKTPYWLYAHTDAFAWIDFLIQTSKEDENRRLETVLRDGLVAYGDRIHIDESNLLITAMVGAAVVLVVLITLYVIVAIIAKKEAEGSLAESECGKTSRSVHRLRSASIRTLGLLVLLWYFSLYPLSALSTFEIAMEFESAEITGVLAIALICLLVCLVFLAVCGRVILHKTRDELLQFEKLATWGSLYAEYTYNRRMFFMITAFVQILTGVFVGTLGSSVTQLTLVIAVQLLYVVAVVVCAPFAENLVRNIVLVLTSVKILNYALSFAYIHSSSLGMDGRSQVGNAFIIINTLLICCWFLRHLVIFGTYIRAWMVKNEQEMATPTTNPMGTGKYDPSAQGTDLPFVHIQSSRSGPSSEGSVMLQPQGQGRAL